ncbi:MAG: hypothetical protein PHC97_00805 [Patescibacteria group bacterium]|nr:hypothetical protein [Patescibacteria group bacterium]
MEIILDMLDIEQRSGIFQVPPSAKRLGAFKSSYGNRNAFKRGIINLPCIIEGERYFRSGIEKRLVLHYSTVRKLCESGLLRSLTKSKSNGFLPLAKKPISPLSIAQTLSWLLGVPIEEILKNRFVFKSGKFASLTAKERVKILFQAYRGCEWFEKFLTRQEKHLEFLKKKKLMVERPITRSHIEDWFTLGFDYRICQNLIKNGLIIPEGRFKNKSMHNYIDLEAFAQLLSLITGVEYEEIFCQGYSSALKAMADKFVVSRLRPFMLEMKIKPSKLFTIAEAGKLLGISYQTLFSALKRGFIKNFPEGQNTAKILGVDLAIYGIKHKWGNILIFRQADVLNIFGVQGNVNLRKLGVLSSPEGTYSKHHYVFPLYDKVAEVAREKYFSDSKNQDLLFLVGRSNLVVCVDGAAKENFLQTYDLDIFDEDSESWLEMQLARPESIGEKEIITRDLVITISPKDPNVDFAKVKSFKLRID